MTNKEYRFLISEPNFTVDTLWNLLENNNITNFDPVKEAFKVPEQGQRNLFLGHNWALKAGLLES